MDFEKLYSSLPGFIKYNDSILSMFLGFAKKLRNTDYFKAREISPDDFKPTDTLRNIQLFHLELLRFIDNVCDKHNIDYWITGGTLLGAVRHDGFIPWDDDVDITFMREDYDKFIEVFPIEISRFDYFKQECGLSLLRNNHENYFKDFNSIYDFEGNRELLDSARFMFFQVGWLKPYIKIDCFPEDYVEEDKLNHFEKNYRSTKYKFNQDVKKGKKQFNDEMEIQNKYLGFTRNKTKYFNDGLDSLQLYPVSIRETEKTFPLSRIKFEKYEFKCPKDTDYYLNLLFGSDYMQLPELIETHNFTDFIESQFNSKREMDEKFKKDLEYLKNINDNFE